LSGRPRDPRRNGDPSQEYVQPRFGTVVTPGLEYRSIRIALARVSTREGREIRWRPSPLRMFFVCIAPFISWSRDRKVRSFARARPTWQVATKDRCLQRKTPHLRKEMRRRT